jgi:hypothetical protein
MLPHNIRDLLAEVVLHKKREHTRERNNQVREFTFKMARQGLFQPSSALINGKTDIYCEAFDKFATGVWNEIQRVLNSCGLEYYAGYEGDLIKLLKESLTVCGEADRKSLFDNRESGFTGVQAFNSGKFDNRRGTITEKLVTEIKIFTSKLQATQKPKEIIEAIGPVVYANIKIPKEKIPWSVEKWCAVIGTVIAVIGLIWGITWAIFVWYKPSAATTPATKIHNAQTVGDNNGQVAQIFGSSNVVNFGDNKIYFRDTSHPLFKLYVNDPEQETTNGSWVLLSGSREIQLFVKNVSKNTVSGTIIDFIPEMVGDATTNLITEHWNLQGKVITTWHFKNTNTTVTTEVPEYRFPVGSAPPNIEQRLPSIFISANITPQTIPSNVPNFYLPALFAHFLIYADGSELQEFHISFYLKEQGLPPKDTNGN